VAIRDIAAYTHLSQRDIDAFGAELDAIRSDVEDSLGVKDAAYIRHVIVFQRVLDVVARLLIVGWRSRLGWSVGTLSLAYAKSVENMEIGHNVCHGQWDWMNDSEIHSTAWEWDMVGSSAQWRYSHNYRHHVYTNVHGMDDDLGFGVMRVSRDQPWEPANLAQPLANLLLALTFEWGIARHGFHSDESRASTAAGKRAVKRTMLVKMAHQTAKDYLVLPALGWRRWRRVLTANIAANLLRNLWAYVVIFCGHFPDGVQTFAPEIVQEETRAEWYLRQMLGTANFKAGPLLAFSSGNLCYQIEHHLFPDLPSNRYAQISLRVRELCDKYDVPYTSGSLARQYLQTLRTNFRLALPDRVSRAAPAGGGRAVSSSKSGLS